MSRDHFILPPMQMKPPRQDGQSAEEAAGRIQSVEEHMERLHDVAVEIAYLLEFVSLNMRVRRQQKFAVL